MSTPLIVVMAGLGACSPIEGVASSGDDASSLPEDTGERWSGTETPTVPDETDSDPTAPDTDDSGDTDTPTAPAEDVVRFVVLGDGGEGNDTQYAVADAMAAVCAAKTDDRAGCDFALYLGDNFYYEGVYSVDDEQFQSKFELPYAGLDLPFHVVLGNHDYGSWSILEDRASYEVAYTAESTKWNMPDNYYTFNASHVQLFGLDTTAIMNELIFGDSDQRTWLPAETAASTATWKLAFGHHPYISNGGHGNAGEYEGYDWLPIANGATVLEFMNDSVCGDIDVYFAGHDHNRQWLEKPAACDTEFIVSGAAAKTSDLEDRGNATWFEDADLAGFVWVEIRGNTFRGEFWNENGGLDYAREITK